MATRKKPVKKKVAPPASIPLADGIPVHCAHDKIVKRNELRPNPRNPNQHPESQVELLAKVIKAGGWRAPITVSLRSGLMVRGHCRLLSAERMGVDEAPVDFQNYDTDADEWADLLADNRIAELAEPDFGVLRDLLVEMDTGEIDMDLTGFDEAALEEIMTWTPEPGKKPPEDPGPTEPPAEPQTKIGDLWILGDHRLLCGDSTKAEDVERLMDGEKADMVFTDPPYGVSYDGGAKKRERLAGDSIGTEIYGKALPALRVAAADHAPLYLWYADGHAAAAAAAGYQIVAQIIWAKNHAQFVTAAHYKGKHEPCLYGHRKGKSASWHGPNNEVTLWECDRSPRNNHHPTQKPVPLAERAMGNSTRRGDLVIDLFLGGGCTLIAAERLSRRCYGLEIDPAYCDVICRRWAEMTGQTPTLEDGTPFVLES